MIAWLLLALAGTGGEPTAAVPNPSADVICRRESLTGTRFQKKLCMTRAAWDAKTDSDARALAEMRGRSGSSDAQENRENPFHTFCIGQRC